MHLPCHAGCLPAALQQDAEMGEATAQPDEAGTSEPDQAPTILAAQPAADASEEIVLKDAEDDAGSLPDLEDVPPGGGPQAPAAEGACLPAVCVP